MAAPHPAVGWTRRGGRAAGGGREPGSGKRAAGAVRGGSAEPLPPLPGALRAAALRAALGHAPAAGRCGSAAPRPLRAPPPVPAAGLCWGATVGGCPRTAAVPGRRLSPAGGCHQTGSGSPWQSAPRLHRSAPTSRGEERGEECCSSGGGTSGPGQAQPPPRGTATPTPAGPRQQRRSAAPPAPQPPPPRPDPCPAPLRGAAEAKEPPRRGGQRGSLPLLNGIFLPRTPPFYFLFPKIRAAPLEAGGSLGRGAPGSCGARRAGGAAVCQRCANVPKCHRCATDVPQCHRSVTDVPPGCRAPAGFSLRSPRS